MSEFQGTRYFRLAIYQQLSSLIRRGDGPDNIQRSLSNLNYLTIEKNKNASFQSSHIYSLSLEQSSQQDILRDWQLNLAAVREDPPQNFRLEFKANQVLCLYKIHIKYRHTHITNETW